MEVKAKKCKGTGKAIDFGCGTMQLKRIYGLGISCKCYQNWLLNSDAGREKINKTRFLAKNKVEKETKTKELVKKKKLYDNVTNWKNEFQKKINKIVRLIDNGLTCLAREKGGQIHAGHIYARGGNQYIRYNLHNIHRQNAQSNHFQNDDGLLRDGVVREYGLDYMEFITSLKQTPKPNYTNDDFQNFTENARKIVSRLKKDNLKYSLEKRLVIRNEINLELGFYEEKYCEYKKPT